jgi:hypothetical protein
VYEVLWSAFFVAVATVALNKLSPLLPIDRRWPRHIKIILLAVVGVAALTLSGIHEHHDSTQPDAVTRKRPNPAPPPVNPSNEGPQPTATNNSTLDTPPPQVTGPSTSSDAPALEPDTTPSHKSISTQPDIPKNDEADDVLPGSGVGDFLPTTYGMCVDRANVYEDYPYPTNEENQAHNIGPKEWLVRGDDRWQIRIIGEKDLCDTSRTV